MMGEGLDGEVARARIELEIVLNVNFLLYFNLPKNMCTMLLQNLPKQSYCLDFFK